MPEHENGLLSVLVDLATGAILQVEQDKADTPSLNDFADTSPILFGNNNVSWDTIFSVLDAQADSLEFQDLVLLSEQRIFVAHRLASDPGLALLTIAPAERGIGLVLSESRSRITTMMHKD